MIVPIGDPPAPDVLDDALDALDDGEVIAIPADTTYMLAADPFVPGATDHLFTIKHRARDIDLPVLVGTLEQALSLVTAVPHAARRLMEAFWPGALTLVLPRHPDLTADLGEDELTVGVRMPDHPVPLALCREAGPLAAAAAGRQNRPDLTLAAEVAATFGDDVAVVLDAGPCTGGPSTVVDATGEEPHLIREGQIAWSDILEVVKR